MKSPSHLKKAAPFVLSGLLSFPGLSLEAKAQPLENVQRQTNTQVISAAECKGLKKNYDKYESLEGYVKQVTEYLCDDYKGLLKEDFIKQEFGYLGLMQLARSLVNLGIMYPEKKQKLIILQKEVIRRFMDPKTSPYQELDLMNVEDLGDYNDYLYNLSLTLASYHHLTGTSEYKDLQNKISAHLYSKIVNAKDAHIKASPEDKEKVVAHTAAAIYSLYLNDQQNKTNYTQNARNHWLTHLTRNGLNRRYKLPYSSLYGKDRDIPRGSYTSLLIYYVSKFDPKFAEILYKNFTFVFKQDVLVGYGMREWPEGVNRDDDPVAGATIMGIGISATAYTMATSKSLNDQKTFETIRDVHNTAKNTFNYFGNSKIQKLIDTIMAGSILLSSETETPWE